MLASETKIFLNLPNQSKQRILHPATVKETKKRGYTAELEEPDVAIQAGQDLFVYYELKRKFVKQPARIDAVMQTDPVLVVGFQITGEPMSAESREWFRVSTVMANLTASVGAESECRLLDVSTAGFAVEATKRYEVGQIVPVTLRYEGSQFSGQARIQSMRQMNKGRFRYGLHAIEDKASGGDLRKGQQHISAAIEREQLRRLSRSG
ncbi:MAG: PilZ domain-containing protein [Planctomycetota bacterium]